MIVLIARAALALSLLQGAPDSARLVRGARAAQMAFEAFRRNRLPTGPGMGGACEVRIGRYCYWRGDNEDDDTPPPEHPAVRQRRDELLRTLDSASRLIPGDGWIAGQRVRYLVEADRTDDAIRFALSDCRASPAWCNALAGYAAHVGARYATADSAYEAALSAMDPAERCRWLDVSDLVADDLEHRFKSLDCARREGFVRRLFWLGAPLYSISETDLLTEHLSRLTRARLAERSASIDGAAWADDVRSLVIRYGWSRWYTRTLPVMGSLRDASYTGHDAGVPYDFLPNAHAVEHLGSIVSDDWHLENDRALTGYAPAYARSVHEVPHQIALFRRGDSTLVIAAWDARRDTTLLGRSLDAALVLSADGARRAIETQTGAKVVGRIAATGLVDSGVVSLELLAAKDRRASRTRVGVAARDTTHRVTLSDLLLYAPTGSASNELSAVRDSALASAIIPATRGVGVYWETYGLRAEGEPVQFALTVERIGVDWMHRAAEKLHLADPTTSLRIQWDDVPQRVNGIAGRGVRVDLSRLVSGTYRMQLTVTPVGEGAVSAVREIEVR
ncbi:MAG: hypothetical protein JWM41_398 [Gemmatimonadetes bacterium]|nr:hypothetical protein [Gemmatimonadota bacterium]